MQKFGYPATTVAETDSWAVLVRPQQVTLGSLVLACKEPATAFAEIGPAAFSGLPGMIGGIEAMLRSAFAYDKINYLMLMMVDREVHFHVIPRYAEPRRFAGIEFRDAGWPRTPELGQPTAVPDDAFRELVATLRAAWPRSAP
jgi:diadenosine tetraphosphate (Ap4A) HIT family hydrolase